MSSSILSRSYGSDDALFPREPTQNGVGRWRGPNGRISKPMDDWEGSTRVYSPPNPKQPVPPSGPKWMVSLGDAVQEETVQEAMPLGVLHGIAVNEADNQWFVRTADEPFPAAQPVTKRGEQRGWILPVMVFVVIFLITTILGGCATRKLFPKKMGTTSKTVSLAPAAQPVLWIPPKNEIPLVEPAPAATPSTSAQPRAEASKSAAAKPKKNGFHVDTNI